MIAALEKALGDHVTGVEKNHGIARRLAVNLATMGGRKPALVAKQQILLLAAQGVPKGHRSQPSAQPRSVSENLNDLLNTIRGQRAPSQLISSLLNAVITSVLFCTHGVHFDDTRAAHKAFRDADHALKNRHSEVRLGTRITTKRRLLEAYKSAIFRRAGQAMLVGFPTTARIQSVWIMTDYKSPSVKRAR